MIEWIWLIHIWVAVAKETRTMSWKNRWESSPLWTSLSSSISATVVSFSHFVIRGNVLSVTDIYSIQGLTWFSCAVCTRFDSLSAIGSTAFSSQAAARSRCKRILGGASTWPSRHSRPAGAHDWRIPPYERHAFAWAHRAAAHSAVPHTGAGWSSFAASTRPLRDGRLEARI